VSADHDSEVLSNVQDKTLAGLPREGARRKNGAPPRPPSLWTMRPVFDGEPEPVWGAFPKGFLRVAARMLRAQPDEILHLCSGSVAPGHGTRVDVRAEASPDVRADARRLPFRDASFKAVLIDPPYTVEYARDLYACEYPRPSHLLAEASRVVKPCGRVGILHFLVPMSPAGLQLETVRGVTTGAGYRIRAFSVYQREQSRLL
jgi:hypothetical protein